MAIVRCCVRVRVRVRVRACARACLQAVDGIAAEQLTALMEHMLQYVTPPYCSDRE